MREEIKDIKLTDEEYIKKLENAIANLNNYCDKLQQENTKLKDEIEWYKQQCDDLEMQIGCMNNE